MTGINISKIIQNLEFVNSFCCANLVAGERKHLASDLCFRCSLSAFPIRISELGPVQTGRPPPVEGGGWESESLRVFNTRRESGNGTRELRAGSRRSTRKCTPARRIYKKIARIG